MAKLDWEKANARETIRREGYETAAKKALHKKSIEWEKRKAVQRELLTEADRQEMARRARAVLARRMGKP